MSEENETRAKWLGVKIDELLLMLEPGSVKARLDDGALVALNNNYTTRIRVAPPERYESEKRPIRAVVQIISELPPPMQDLLKSPEMTVAMNSFAALGALTSERGKVFVGSRLTIFEAEDAWDDLHLPLLACTTICATEAIFGAVRRSYAGEIRQGGVSAWTVNDFEQAYRYLSESCFCNTAGLRFTAEFGLIEGAMNAVDGGHGTALFQMNADEPHLELGGGLFCSLEMPHQLGDEKSLKQICVQLNNMEMAARDQPPHFGAWCAGRRGNNPAYVSFFPNVMVSISGIAVNAAFWARYRADWANGALASLGVHL